jgi:tricorn protease
MKLLQIFLALSIGTSISEAQISAKLMRDIDLSDTQITFVYGGDIWLAPKAGGQALQLTNSPGQESYPKFSPDGSEIAFSASYNGNQDVYVMPTSGGIPTRITYASYGDRMVDWHPNGRKILFASRRETGIPRVNQFFLVDKTGGFPEKMPVPYGELASFAPDGNKLAYITKITENYPFKRYRGGLTSDVIIFDLQSKKAENITDNLANDGRPAWSGDKIYFLSDQGENMRRNIWSYDTNSKQSRQLTNLEDFDIAYMAAGTQDLAFEAGGDLYLMNLATGDYKKIAINVVTDLSTEMPTMKNVGGSIQNYAASPGGKRIIFEARGELFNAPVKKGYVANITRSSGAFDQSPAWSPDGKSIAYWSDKSGEYEIYLQSTQVDDEAKKLTSRNKGFGYTLFWSPDSKKIAFVDERNVISIIDVASGSVTEADRHLWNIGHGSRFGFPINWSPDSKFITYTNDQQNGNGAIFVYGLEDAKVRQVTSGFYSDSNPVFSKDGKYLFYFTNRQLNAAYSDMGDGTWIYPNSTQLAVLSLTKDVDYLLNPKNDELSVEEEESENDDDQKDKKKKQGDDDDKEEEKKQFL